MIKTAEKKIYRKGQFLAERFRELPERAQELWFEFYENRIAHNDLTSLLFFYICGCDYSECKSPIEVLFLFAFDLYKCEQDFPDICLYSQYEIKKSSGEKYVADFVFDASECSMTEDGFESYKLIIECDGHEFHEKTKEQVERGNIRNMELQEMGYEILHFSGSQIYKNPYLCAIKTYKYILKKIGYRGGKS